MAKKIGSVIIIVLILFFGWKGYEYLHYRKANAVSDAAFIKSDELVMLGFKVGGKVIEMRKNEHQKVKKNEILAIIDPKDFLKSKEKILQKIKALTHRIEALQLQKSRLAKNLDLESMIATQNIEAISKNIEAKNYQIEAMKAHLDKLRSDELRYRSLLKRRLIAKERFETIHTKRVALQKEIEAMQKELEALRVKMKQTKKRAMIAKNQQKIIKELEKKIEASQNERQALQKAIEIVNLKISYTKLIAPFDGVVAKKFFDAPKVVKKGSPVYAITDPKKLYCEVLLSEKKLRGVHPGNAVKIEVDAIPDRIYQGRVESIAPTSAATFSLVPRDIASGEFTKLDQRFKVRIKLKDIKDLRAGMGATVAIKRSKE